MPILQFLLLSSGLFSLCSCVYREYFLINEMKRWDEAQSYCRKNFTDLATIGNHDDAWRMSTSAGNNVTTGIWIGLRRTRSRWLWYAEDTWIHLRPPQIPESPAWFINNWCGGVMGDGRLQPERCDTLHPFVCQEESGVMHLVLQNKTWGKAWDYCQQSNSILAIFRSVSEAEAKLEVFLAQMSFLNMIWIGLLRDQWKWSDNSDASFRQWEVLDSICPGDCVTYNPLSKAWCAKNCTTKLPFYCYTGKTRITKKLVRVEIKSNSLLNFSVVALADSILSELQKVNELELRLKWMVKPDGKIFQKKKKGD